MSERPDDAPAGDPGPPPPGPAPSGGRPDDRPDDRGPYAAPSYPPPSAQPHPQPAYGQQHGQQQYGQPYGPGYGQPYGPGYGQPYGPGYGHPPHGAPGPWRPPVAQPGVVPLRHLNLGDVFGGALQTIRRNPRTTIALSLAVSAVFMALPLLASLLAGVVGDTGSVDPFDAFPGDGALVGLATYSGFVLNLLASLVITGLMTRVVASAVVGRPMRAGEAWSRTRKRLPGLLLLVLVSTVVSLVAIGVPAAVGGLVGYGIGGEIGLVLLAVLGALVGLVPLAWVWTRYLLLATPALVLEGLTARAALRRAGALSRAQFWRLLGIALLAQLAAAVVAQVFALPLAGLGTAALFLVDSSWGLALSLVATNLSTLLTTALVGPFVAGVTTLQYVDQRFRREGLDLALLEDALGDRPG